VARMDAGSQNFGRPETRLNEESAAGTLGCVVALQGTPAPIEQVARAAGIGQAKVAASGVGAQPDAAPGCVAPWTRVRGFGPGQFDGCGRSGVVDGRKVRPPWVQRWAGPRAVWVLAVLLGVRTRLGCLGPASTSPRRDHNLGRGCFTRCSA